MERVEELFTKPHLVVHSKDETRLLASLAVPRSLSLFFGACKNGSFEAER